MNLPKVVYLIARCLGPSLDTCWLIPMKIPKVLSVCQSSNGTLEAVSNARFGFVRSVKPGHLDLSTVANKLALSYGWPASAEMVDVVALPWKSNQMVADAMQVTGQKGGMAVLSASTTQRLCRERVFAAG